MSEFDEDQFRRPMSRGQSVTLLVASAVLLVGGLAVGWALLPASNELNQAGHLFKSQSRQAASDLLYYVPFGVAFMGLAGIWSALKGLVQGK